jgi:peroxiredoxin family protein
MESTKSTTILNEILQKLSLITKEDELAQDINEEDVQEEVVLSEEVQEETEELNEETPQEEVEVEAEEESTDLMEGYVKEEKFNEVMSAMKAELDALKEAVKGKMQEYKSQKEELSKQVEELSAEPAAEPIKHAPESDEPKRGMFTNPNKPMSTLDRVMQRLSN